MSASVSGSDNSTNKDDRKAQLKAEAARLGIPYKELKQQKKDMKKKKRKSESERLLESSIETNKEQKRMRSWSGEGEELNNNTNNNNNDSSSSRANKRVRTRSMDAAEEKKEEVEPNNNSKLSVEEWRKGHNMKVMQHGRNNNNNDSGGVTDTTPYFEFSDAPFDNNIQIALKSAGYEKPTPIQSQAWPIAIQARDMICVAKTGSGKTAGFLLPSIHQHQQNSHKPVNGAPMLLVLAPTRELAVQISEESNKFARRAQLRTVCLFGGAPKYPQISTLKRGVDIVIATPGRLNDLLEMRKIDLSQIQHLVLDEADRMLDMGFEPQIRSIISQCPNTRQTLLFSATWPKEIQKLAHDFLKDNAVQINVGSVDKLEANKDIAQTIMMMTEYDKPDKLKEVLDENTINNNNTDDNNNNNKDPSIKQHPKMIIFVSRKSSCDTLANDLWHQGFAVDSLHGDRAQWERTKVMNAFKNSTLKLLIATDVAARGLDVKDVELVINYDMPAGVNGLEDYVHRIGRTGRAGKKGKAIAFFTEKDSKRARELVELLDKANQPVPDELRAKGRDRKSVV